MAGGCASGPVPDDDPTSPMVRKMAAGASAVRAANLFKPGALVEAAKSSTLQLSGEAEQNLADVVYGGRPQSMNLSEMRRSQQLWVSHLKKVRETERTGDKIMRRLRFAQMSGAYTIDRPKAVVEMVKQWNAFLDVQSDYTFWVVKLMGNAAQASRAAQASLQSAIGLRAGTVSLASYEQKVGRAGQLLLAVERRSRDDPRPSSAELVRAARRAHRALTADSQTKAINDAVQERFGATLALPE